jgi:diguanylate cyclase (GGDEF)-like protein
MADLREKVFSILRASIPEPGRRNLVEAYIKSLERDLGRAKEDAITDELTCIDNRKSFEISFKRMILRSLRLQFSRSANSGHRSILATITKGWKYPISCVMCDIDHFKNINDTYGHQAGDMALKFFADFLQSDMREMDSIGRFGGEEFILAFENASYKDAFRKVDSMRDKIKKIKIHSNIQIKFSSGVISSEHMPEVVLLYSKKILPLIRDFLKGKAVGREIKALAKQLKRQYFEVEQWFLNIAAVGREFKEKGYHGGLEDLVTHDKIDLVCYMYEKRADEALYRAKETGRDKVCIWTFDGIIEST